MTPISAGRPTRMTWSLAAQLRLAFGAALLMTLGVVTGAWWGAINYGNEINRAYQTQLRTTVQLAEAQSAFWELRYDLRQFMNESREGQQQILEKQDQLYAVIEERLAAYDQAASSPEERRALTHLRSAYQRYRQVRPKFFELWEAGEKDDAIAWITLATAPFGEAAAREFEAQIALQQSYVNRDRDRSEDKAGLALALVTALTLVLLAILFAGYAYAFRMLRPIVALREETRRIMRDELGETVDAAAGGNEITVLKENFQVMTDRLLAHSEALRHARERLAFLLGATPAIIYSAQPRGDYAVTFMSENVRAILGYEPEEFVRDPRFGPSHIHPDDRKRVFAALASIQTQDRHADEYRYRHKDGSWRWMHTEMTLIRDASGVPGELVGYWIDITRRKQAEDAQARLAMIVQYSNDAIHSRAPDGTIQSWNAAAERLYGYTAAEAIGRYLILVPPELQHEFTQTWELARQGELSRISETVRIAKDGRRIAVAHSVFPLRNDNGDFVGTAVIAHDISARKRAEAMLAEALRAKTEFMNNVTHELRTPLNSVIGFAELLKDEVPGPLNAKQAQFAADILASGEHLLALVEGILEMSRLDGAAAALEREPVEIGAALEACVAAHRKAAQARGIAVQVDVAPDTCRAELDPKALRRMLDALISNAIRFNRDGGTVAVSARRANGALEIAVTDTGIGIARADLAKLFKPLVQLDEGLARKHGGVGLGLALARRLAELHGGTIDVESEFGKGSSFTLRLRIVGHS